MADQESADTAGVSVDFGRNARRYTLTVAVVLSLILCASIAPAFVAAQTDAFLLYGGGGVQEMITKAKIESVSDHNADVVIVGDSAGLVGVDPSVIKHDLGLTAYNMTLTVSSFLAIGSDLLDRYLLENRPPKFIILYLSPWATPSKPADMVSESDQFPLPFPNFEATYAIDNLGNPLRLGIYLIRYPEQIIPFAITVISRLTVRSLLGPKEDARIRGALATNDGWLPFARGLVGIEHVSSLPDNCHYTERAVHPDIRYLKWFREHYATPQTRVVVFIAPIPECDRSLDQLKRAYAGLVDDPPAAMQNHYFAADFPRRFHLLEEGAEINTHHVAAAIGSLMDTKSNGE
jgi:hypothetical protein